MRLLYHGCVFMVSVQINMLAISRPETEAIPAIVPLWTWRPGSVTQTRDGFRVVFNLHDKRIDKSFSVKQYGSREKAWVAANQFRNETSKELGLTLHIFSSRLGDVEKQRIAGLIDGDGCIRLARKGNLVIKVGQSQNNGLPEILSMLTKAFPHSTISKPKSDTNQTHRLQYEWIINGMFALPLLEIIANYGILKAPQAKLIFDTIMEKKTISCHDLYESISRMKNKNEYQKVLIDKTNITPAYLAGLFMAEGYVGVTHHTSINITITQTSCINLLHSIAAYFGFGSIGVKAYKACSDNARTVIHVILPYLCGPKREQCLLALELHKYATQLVRDDATKQKLIDWKKQITELKKI